MQADFTQNVNDNRGKVIQKSYGRMAMQRPGKFRWQVTKPIPQLIIANQSRLWIYDPDLEQVTIRSLTRVAGETPALLLSHVDGQLNNDFSIASAPNSSAKMLWFTLTPKKSDSTFATVEMAFLNKQIQVMRLKDHLGHTTLIQFKNIKTNLNLSASLFTFKAPKNVDVIDETHQKE